VNAIVLSAGRGSRLGKHIPKSLIKIGEKTLVELQVDALREYVEEIVVVTGYKHHLMKKMAKKLEITTVWNPLSDITENIVSLACARKYFTKPLLILNGDLALTDLTIKKIVKENGNVLAVERWRSDPDENGEVEFYHDYDEEAMKVQVRNWKITKISKELGKWEAWGEYIGVAKIDDTSLLESCLNHLIRNGFVNEWYESTFNLMIRKKATFTPSVIGSLEFWTEIDTLDDLETARKLFQR